MKNLLILGAGTAGTMMANQLRSKLKKDQWQITIVDQNKTHYYQPGFLFLPFDIYTEDQVKKVGKKFIPNGVNYVQKKIDRIFPEENKVKLEDETINYDILIIATGSKIAPEEVEGMKGKNWHKNVFDFYTYEGALALRNKLRDWQGGKMVVHLTEMPIKCPVAPLEFAFLADSYFKEKGMRDKVELTYVTPLSGAFTKEKSAETLGYLLEEKKINLEIDFAIESVDNENNKIIDYGGKEVEYDLLVTIPTNMGDDVIERSGMGDDLNFVPTDHHTLQSKDHENVFVIGDATDVPASKAGSVAHFQSETLTDNILLYKDGKPLKEEFDGHANCFIETGDNKALLIDFNYKQEPVEGTFPFSVIGPLKLLKESVFNHWGKLAFRWIYWNMLLKGIPIPFVGRNMSTKGKKL
ncbi:type III sulfide quinone reductase, selenoprotein subtype [Salegentibacter salarius]|uniref:Oxidoreductase n=1 Tax=Salegentibacter salarius TaxID=435906 RepID=A0A2N0TUV5_9FLAO|nr:FAD/NAD(P)-binding oxidoreductase [Salegentibacter salarius]OEY72198.1 oxidoreductase [Salegentibacter salarius]PKD18519.1 oxidoreductase [Salegentibacter salarius]SLJ88079.1 sulfide:quinone oxidoreductase [Salegentibacter salarius]